MSKRVFLSVLSFAAFILVTLVVILLAQGYRFDRTHVYGTGIIVVQSNPSGATVTLNNQSPTASTATYADLLPASYTVTVSKDGYSSWKEQVTVSAGKVANLQVLLLPINPSLAPVTATAATRPVLSPDGQKLAYEVTSGTSAGVWLLDLTSQPFSLTKKPQQIVSDSAVLAYSSGTLSWSPDSRDLLDTLDNGLSTNSYLLSATQSHEPQDISSTRDETLAHWQEERSQSLTELSADLDTKDKALATQYTDSLQWSPDNLKFLYWHDQGDQVVYGVYDKETKQQLQTFSTPKKRFSVVRWYADSQHLLLLDKDSIESNSGTVSMMGMDGSNKSQVYSGTLIGDALYSYLDGAKLLILTSFNQQENTYYLYSINLR